MDTESCKVLVQTDDAGRVTAINSDAFVSGDGWTAIDEGEGDTTAAAWRHTHESFWNAPEYRNEFADPDFPLNDDSLVVFEHFKVVRLLDSMANKTADGYEQQV